MMNDKTWGRGVDVMSEFFCGLLGASPSVFFCFRLMLSCPRGSSIRGLFSRLFLV